LRIEPLVPWVPTPEEILDDIVELLEIDTKSVFIDLGAGDGRVAIAAAKRGAFSIALEIDIVNCIIARDRAKLENTLVDVIQGDFETFPLNRVNRVFMYLYSSIHDRLKSKMIKELPKGARIVTLDFPIPGWTPLKVKRCKTKSKTVRTLYLYIKGLSEKEEVWLKPT